MAEFDVSWPEQPFYSFTGFDQLLLYTPRYRFVAWSLLAVFVFWIVVEFLPRRVRPAQSVPLVLAIELYLVAFCATSLLPQDMRLSVSAAWLGLLVSRLTVISAIFGLCILSCLQPEEMGSAATLACAAFFFALLLQRHRRLESPRIPRRVHHRSPTFGHAGHPSARNLRRIPASLSFTISSTALASNTASPTPITNPLPPSSAFAPTQAASQSPWLPLPRNGSRELRRPPTDPPFKNIYQCDPADFTVLCIRDLHPGQQTGLPEDDPED